MMDAWIDGWMCGKWMNEKYTVRSRLTVEYYAAMKSSEVTQATAWMDPEHRVLSERSRHRRTDSGWFHLHKESERGKSTDTGGRLVVS